MFMAVVLCAYDRLYPLRMVVIVQTAMPRLHQGLCYARYSNCVMQDTAVNT